MAKHSDDINSTNADNSLHSRHSRVFISVKNSENNILIATKVDMYISKHL